MEKVKIELERDEFNDLLKAVDFGAEWMCENAYRDDEKRFRAIYDKLKEL